MKKPMQKLIITSALSFLLLGGIGVAYAAPIESNSVVPDLNFQIPIGTEKSTKIIETRKETENGQVTEVVYATGIGNYIAIMYRWLLGAMAIVTVLIIMVAGLMWMTAAGNTSRIKEAQKYISNALLGLVTLFGSYTILYILNPDLVNIGPLRLGGRVENVTAELPAAPASDQIGTNNGPVIMGGTCTGNMSWQGQYSGMTADDINKVLTGSPLAGLGPQIYQASQDKNVDPAFALGFWWHESNFGAKGVASTTKNPGNITATQGEVNRGKGCFVKDRNWLCYNSWSEGVVDWFRYIRLWGAPGNPASEQKINGMLTGYAPKGENNVPAYIDAVCKSMISWAKPDKKANITQQCGCK